MSDHAIPWLRPTKSFPGTWTKFPPQPGRLYVTCPWDLWDLSLYHLPPHSLGFNLSGLLFLPQTHQGHVYLRFYTVSSLPWVLFPYNPCTCIISDFSLNTRGLPWWLSGKDSACSCRRHGFDPWVGKIPWSRKWQPVPVFLPEKFCEQGGLAGYRVIKGCRVVRVGHKLATKQQ